MRNQNAAIILAIGGVIVLGFLATEFLIRYLGPR